MSPLVPQRVYSKCLWNLILDLASSSSSKKPADKRPLVDSKDSKDSKFSKKFNWKDWMVHVPKGQDKFWYPAQTLPPPQNFTPGLIPLLKTHLNKSHAGGNTRRAVLCHDRAVLVTREIWDASWGCGFVSSFLVIECHPDPLVL